MVALLHNRNAALAAPDNPLPGLRAAQLAAASGNGELAVTILKEVSALSPHPAHLHELDNLQAHRCR